MWTCEEERVVRALVGREKRILLAHPRFGKIEFERSGEHSFIRRDVLSDEREVVETGVPPEAVVVAVFRAVQEGWKICR